MSDLFREKVPNEYIERVFDVMEPAGLHTFQLLTKRSGKVAEWDASRRRRLRARECGAKTMFTRDTNP